MIFRYDISTFIYPACSKVSGCSAGSLGAQAWANDLLQDLNFNEAAVVKIVCDDRLMCEHLLNAGFKSFWSTIDVCCVQSDS